jgi:hypothetical protein
MSDRRARLCRSALLLASSGVYNDFYLFDHHSVFFLREVAGSGSNNCFFRQSHHFDIPPGEHDASQWNGLDTILQGKPAQNSIRGSMNQRVLKIRTQIQTGGQ